WLYARQSRTQGTDAPLARLVGRCINTGRTPCPVFAQRLQSERRQPGMVRRGATLLAFLWPAPAFLPSGERSVADRSPPPGAAAPRLWMRPQWKRHAEPASNALPSDLAAACEGEAPSYACSIPMPSGGWRTSRP